MLVSGMEMMEGDTNATSPILMPEVQVVVATFDDCDHCFYPLVIICFRNKLGWMAWDCFSCCSLALSLSFSLFGSFEKHLLKCYGPKAYPEEICLIAIEIYLISPFLQLSRFTGQATSRSQPLPALCLTFFSQYVISQI